MPQVLEAEGDLVRGIGSHESPGQVWEVGSRDSQSGQWARQQSLFCRNELPGSSSVLYQQGGGNSGTVRELLIPATYGKGSLGWASRLRNLLNLS